MKDSFRGSLEDLRLVTAAAALGVALAAAIVMSPVLDNDFTNWDDSAYVSENDLIRDPSPMGLWRIATAIQVGHFHPVTMLSYVVDYRLSASDPGGYHRTNLILHILCTLAVFALAKRLLGSVVAASVTALLFAIHPMNVEAVAWISARKHLLATLFSLGCLHAYLTYLRRSFSVRWLALSLAFFTLALLSNALYSVIALVLPALDLLVHRSLDVRRLWHKVPFYAFSLVAGVGAIGASARAGALGIAPVRPWQEQIALSAENLAGYATHVFLPTKLSSYHPHLDGALPATAWIALASVMLVFVCVALLWRRAPLLFFASVLFVVMLIFVLQWIPVGLARTAERYVYLSYLGPFLLIGSGVQWLAYDVRRKFGGHGLPVWLRATILGVVTLWMLWLGLTSFERAKVWHDSQTLWSDVITRYPDHFWAYNFRGQARFMDGDLDAAIADFTQSIEHNPDYVNAWYNRGNANARRGRLEAAERDFDRALEIDPDLRVAADSRALVRERLGRITGMPHDD